METLAWRVYMYAQMHVWRPEVNTGGLTLSPYSLRCSLPEPGADGLYWLATELCDPLVSTPAARGVTAACCCVQLNAWVLRVQIQVPIIVQHT